MKTRIPEILGDLDSVRENLLALSDDIWLSIDHNDPKALEAGVAFKKTYNEKMHAFDELAEAIGALITTFTGTPKDETPPAVADDADAAQRNARIIRELDRNERHSLDEDFRYKRPCGCIISGKAHKDVTTWRRMYELLCRELLARDEALFRSLHERTEFTSSHGHKAFSPKSDDLRRSTKIADGVYAEVNLSANCLRENMKDLLRVFRASPSEMVVYLREDRDVREGVNQTKIAQRSTQGSDSATVVR